MWHLLYPNDRAQRRSAWNTLVHYAPWAGMAWGAYQVVQAVVDATPATDPLIGLITGGSLPGTVAFIVATTVLVTLARHHDRQWCPSCQRVRPGTAARAAAAAYTLHLAHRLHGVHFLLALAGALLVQVWFTALGYVLMAAIVLVGCWVIARHRALHLGCTRCPHHLPNRHMRGFGCNSGRGYEDPWLQQVHLAEFMDSARRTLTLFHHDHRRCEHLHLACDAPDCTDGINASGPSTVLPWLLAWLEGHHQTHHPHARPVGFTLRCEQPGPACPYAAHMRAQGRTP